METIGITVFGTTIDLLQIIGLEETLRTILEEIT
jgi:hypothetical protein